MKAGIIVVVSLICGTSFGVLAAPSVNNSLLIGANDTNLLNLYISICVKYTGWHKNTPNFCKNYYKFICVDGFALKMAEEPNHCFDDPHGPMKLKEIKQIPGKCVEASCMENGAVMYAGCSNVDTTDPQCELIKGDLQKTYPKCCDIVKCTIVTKYL